MVMTRITSSFVYFALISYIFQDVGAELYVISTWNFTKAVQISWQTLNKGGSAIDAIESGCSTCENLRCGTTVGYGGSPDENGEVTLDALIFDGDTMDMGAVAGLRRIKHASSVARKVLENTEHSILVGDLATQFAKSMGFKEETLSTNYSNNVHKKWRDNNCQPNFWKNVTPDPRSRCGPYKTRKFVSNDVSNIKTPKFGYYNHDTISMIAIDKQGSIAAGTSSNGAKYKIAGRIGDAPIPGAGAYAASDVGGAVATGDGDVMMRFLPSSTIVEMMRHGVKPHDAVQKMIHRIIHYFPKFSGAIIAMSKKGEFAAACHNIDSFPLSIACSKNPWVTIKTIKCT